MRFVLSTLGLSLGLFASTAFAQGAPPDPPPPVAPPPAAPPPAPPAEAPPPPPPPVGAQPTQPPPPPPGGYPPPPPGGYPPPPPPGMYVETPPPPPPAVERGEHLHDGFYMRLSLGANGLRSTIESDLANTEEVKVTGGGLSFDFMLGGTPTPGLVIGGALMLDAASNPTVKSGGDEVDAEFDSSYAFIGPFIDGYFDPEGGFHVGGGIGFTGFSLDNKDIEEDDDKAFGGGGLSLWVGYDAWVSSQWSIGGLLRVSGGSGQRDIERGGIDSTEKATTGTFALLFTALMH